MQLDVYILIFSSVIIFMAGFCGLLVHKTLVRRIIDIEVMTLASIQLLVQQFVENSFLLILFILTASEISIAILLMLKAKNKT